MSWSLEFHAKGAAETRGLPRDAFNALIEVLQTVKQDPYRPGVTVPTDDPRIRQASFGVWGLVSVWVDDDNRVIRVYGVAWAG